ncbi:hypothetical protein [Spirosoma sp. KUDC1026]|uniref:hypothetical protein n=1 Tax=Spirosoma sp. KUDC1026 TaxID=2745947 RepID=UPI00159BD558|nr:hypothetical protein [Spirosoma sp. KUDC1026]QKZ13552.1 hypothetical protein HU175_13280 [Spirosoma sp. KUDC1026]
MKKLITAGVVVAVTLLGYACTKTSDDTLSPETSAARLGGVASGTATGPHSGTGTHPHSGTATGPHSGTATPPHSSTATHPHSGTATPPHSGTGTPPHRPGRPKPKPGH